MDKFIEIIDENGVGKLVSINRKSDYIKYFPEISDVDLLSDIYTIIRISYCHKKFSITRTQYHLRSNGYIVDSPDLKKILTDMGMYRGPERGGQRSRYNHDQLR